MDLSEFLDGCRGKWRTAVVAAWFDALDAQRAARRAASPVAPGAGPRKQTRVPGLQAKLDALAALGAADDVDAFVAAFVPLDLTADEAAGYAGSLKAAPSEWAELVGEVTALARGDGVTAIEGEEDGAGPVTFFFLPPGAGHDSNVDRAVVFTCDGGDWRAEG